MMSMHDDRDKLKDKKTNDLMREKDDVDTKRIEKEREIDRLQLLISADDDERR